MSGLAEQLEAETIEVTITLDAGEQLLSETSPSIWMNLSDVETTTPLAGAVNQVTRVIPAAATVFNLPKVTPENRNMAVGIKDVSPGAWHDPLTNTITVTAIGGDKIDKTGNTTYPINLIQESIICISDGVDSWVIVAVDPPGGGGGGGLTFQDEGSPVAGAPHDTANFAGTGVTVTDAGGGAVLVTIPGATFPHPLTGSADNPVLTEGATQWLGVNLTNEVMSLAQKDFAYLTLLNINGRLRFFDTPSTTGWSRRQIDGDCLGNQALKNLCTILGHTRYGMTSDNTTLGSIPGSIYQQGTAYTESGFSGVYNRLCYVSSGGNVSPADAGDTGGGMGSAGFFKAWCMGLHDGSGVITPGHRVPVKYENTPVPGYPCYLGRAQDAVGSEAGWVHQGGPGGGPPPTDYWGMFVGMTASALSWASAGDLAEIHFLPGYGPEIVQLNAP